MGASLVGVTPRLDLHCKDTIKQNGYQQQKAANEKSLPNSNVVSTRTSISGTSRNVFLNKWTAMLSHRSEQQPDTH